MKDTIKTLLLAGVFSSITACSAISEFTSSTSSTTDAATPDITLNNYLQDRFDSIRKDAATGKGENLEALAQLMGKADSKEFGKFMQVNYEELFSNLEQPVELLSRIEKLENNQG